MKIMIYKTGAISDLNFLWSVRYFARTVGLEENVAIVIGSDEFETDANRIPMPYRPLLCPPGDSDLLIVVGSEFDLSSRYFEIAKFSHKNAYFLSVAADNEIDASKARAFALGLKVDLENIKFCERDLVPADEHLLLMRVDRPHTVEDISGVLVYGEDVPAIFRAVDNLSIMLPDLRIGVLTSSKTSHELERIQDRAEVFRFSEIDIAYLTKRFQVLVDLNNECGGIQRVAVNRMFADQGSLVFSNLDQLPKWRNIVELSGQVADLIQPIALQLSQSGGQFLPRTSDSRTDELGSHGVPPTIGNASVDELLQSCSKAHPRIATLKKAGGTAWLAINGNGLGHAQRVANIAALADPLIPQKVFCFNSCVPFLTERGLDVTPLVSRRVGKVDQNIELLNFGRMAEGAGEADRFVFDGGYPYDSVVAFLQQFDGRKIWVRRGLWKSVQDNTEPRARAKFFDLIIRPGEFFEELNQSDETFRKEVCVGPIVNLTWKARQRSEMPIFGSSGKIRILSMLGSGFIKDRTDILQAICQYCDRRSDVTHTSVIWPQTKFDIGKYKNTVFVSTNHATRLVLDADFVISAAGYNTFGDCMYYQKPAIFLPQQADWLDDQYQRAESARSRGLADLVEEGDILGLLSSLSAFCDDGIDKYRSAFRALDLPEPGNRRISEIIME